MPLEHYIDGHSHIWTPDTKRYPLAKGFTVDEMNPKSFTAEELLAICRPVGVGRVNLIQMSYYEFDNSYMLDAIKQYPDRFVGTAIVDPYSEKPGEAMRALLPKGVRAFRIQPQYSKQPPARWLEPKGYDAMFATGAETGQVLSCLIDPTCFPELDRMCKKYPDTKVIIDHIGRVGVDGSIREKDVQALRDLARHPHIFVKIGAFYALGKKTPPYLDLVPLIKSVVSAFGANRCLWESDCPFQVAHHRYGESLALVRDHLGFLSDDEKDALLRKTAETLLFERR
jgi:predicted TIM-barrel fold metal-dependent hydrolase